MGVIYLSSNYNSNTTSDFHFINDIEFKGKTYRNGDVVEVAYEDGTNKQGFLSIDNYNNSISILPLTNNEHCHVLDDTLLHGKIVDIKNILDDYISRKE